LESNYNNLCFRGVRGPEQSIPVFNYYNIIILQSVVFRNMSVALVLDLSRPVEMWMTLEHWLQVLRTRIDAVLSDLRSSDSTLRDTLRRAAVERIGADHQV